MQEPSLKVWKYLTSSGVVRRWVWQAGEEGNAAEKGCRTNGYENPESRINCPDFVLEVAAGPEGLVCLLVFNYQGDQFI